MCVEVGDRRMPSPPGWAGVREVSCAVLVMTYLNPQPRQTRERGPLPGRASWRRSICQMAGLAGRPFHDWRL